MNNLFAIFAAQSLVKDARYNIRNNSVIWRKLYRVEQYLEARAQIECNRVNANHYRKTRAKAA